MSHRDPISAVVGTAVLALLLAGCAAQASPGQTDAPASTVGEPSEPVASTEPEPEPEPTPAADCDTVFTDDENASLAEDDLVFKDDAFLLGPVMERMAADGALVCNWSKPQSDISVWYAGLDVGDDGEEWIASLEAEGWQPDAERTDGSYLAPADYDGNYQPSVLLDGGVLHFVSVSWLLESLR